MIFRIVLGIYLLIHFVEIIPYAEEIFGTNMPYDHTLIPTYDIFPNILNYVNATVFVTFLALVSGLFASERFLATISGITVLEWLPNVCAVMLWYGWASLVNRNPLIHNPGIPYVGWILLAMAFVEKDEKVVLFNTNNKFLRYIQYDRLHKRLFWSAWFLMAAGYTVSGLNKLLVSPSWIDGSALQHVLESPIARDNMLRDILVQYPTFLKYNTWFSLFLEISFLPLGVFYYTRFWYWMVYMGFHLGILLLINFTDLTIGVMMIHLFTFDWDWTAKINEYMFAKRSRRHEKRKVKCD
jgi:hypothetical protein